MLKSYQTVLKNKTQLSKDVYLFKFDLIDPPELNFSPGQYLLLEVPQIGQEPIKRPYSIASSNQQKTSFNLIVQIIPQGKATSYLSHLQLNDKAVFYGPAGVFTFRANLKNKIFLTTGCGIAPIRSMIFSIYKIINFHSLNNFKDINTWISKESKNNSLNLSKHQPIDIKLFWGLRYYKNIYLFDELKKLAEKSPSFQFKICLSRETNFKKIFLADQKYFSFGHIDKEINKLFLNQKTNDPTFNNTDFYLCGSREIVDSLRNFLLNNKIKETNIFFEKY